MKYVILDESNQPKGIVQAKGFIPKNALKCPENARDISEISIVDIVEEIIVDEIPQEVTYKQAVLDPDKVAIYDAQLNQAETDAAWADLRSKRDMELIKSDWTQGNDAQPTLTAQQVLDWATYRQALRDLPDNVVDINNVEWPVKPA